MDAHRHSKWTRREVLRRISAAAGAGLLGLATRHAMAEPPLETRTIRLVLDPRERYLCFAPLYLVEEFLRLEGFTDVRHVSYDGSGVNGPLIAGTADVGVNQAPDLIVDIDAGQPVVGLSGLHAGCIEVFANDRVPALRDLKGKKVAILRKGGPMHVWLSSIVAFVGLDPERDIEWVKASDHRKWPRLLKEGKIDVVSSFPPQNLMIREQQVGHVILNTTTDEPWRHFFCCMVAARRDFVRDHPIATKRALRAFVKANEFCEADKEGAARLLVARGVTDRYDYALKTLEEVPYGAWRTYDPEDTLRFLALRLREAGLVKMTPNEILERGTDFRFIDELRRELKV